MKYFTLCFLLIFTTKLAHSQAPFTTLIKEPRVLKKTQTLDGTKIFLPADAATTNSVIDNGETATDKFAAKNTIDFFSRNSLSLSLIQKGPARASVNSQVIHYKLYVANPNQSNKYRLNRYNIPLLLITKLSSSYDSTSSSSSIDALDYEAAPVTMRIMPSFRKAFKTYTDVIYWGLYADIRGLHRYDETVDKYQLDLVGGAGIGITYQGDGAAGTYSETGEYAAGKYSISAMLQLAVAEPNVMQSLFRVEDRYAGAFQGYFLFQVPDKNHLNIKVGYQHFFRKTTAGVQSRFSVALGI